MARRTQTPQDPAPRDPSTVAGPAPGPGSVAEAQGGATVIAGRALVQTVRHFFPQLNAWLNRLPTDTPRPGGLHLLHTLPWPGGGWPCTCSNWAPAVNSIMTCARRRPPVLANLNRLAETEQTTLPVHDTLDHFLGHVRAAGWGLYARRWRAPVAHEGPRCRPPAGPTRAVDRRHRPDLLPAAALSALPGATARPGDSLPPSGPGAKIVGAGRDGGVAGQ